MVGRRMTPTATTANAQNQAAGSTSAPVLRFEVPLLNELARGYALGEFRGVFWAEVKK
jgi:hypothetical protein